MRFIKGVILALVLSSCTNFTPKATVKITNLAGNSGGSGSIVEASSAGSVVLTNAHVCGVVKSGGLVHTLDGKSHFVVSYKESTKHDLCLIEVADDLKVHARLGDEAPKMYDTAITSGHPQLLPNIITYGHFSEKKIIQVMTGWKDCTKADLENPNTAFFCIFVGKLPIVKTYEAIAVSTLIQPGSSGSAVYGDNGKIEAVIFAGAGEIGFGFAVPYEFVSAFLNDEANTLAWAKPSLTLEAAANEESKNNQHRKWAKLLDEACNNESLSVTQSWLCDEFESMGARNFKGH